MDGGDRFGTPQERRTRARCQPEPDGMLTIRKRGIKTDGEEENFQPQEIVIPFFRTDTIEDVIRRAGNAYELVVAGTNRPIRFGAVALSVVTWRGQNKLLFKRFRGVVKGSLGTPLQTAVDTALADPEDAYPTQTYGDAVLVIDYARIVIRDFVGLPVKDVSPKVHMDMIQTLDPVAYPVM